MTKVISIVLNGQIHNILSLVGIAAKYLIDLNSYNSIANFPF